MSSIVKKLVDKNEIFPPSFIYDNICFETIMGSEAYGLSTDKSDIDIYGFAVPKKNQLFPHLDGHIEGWSNNKDIFNQYQQHGIEYKEKKYDIQVYNICKYFRLLTENNPNIIDSAFTARDCILFSSPISELVRENRHIFLHKGLWFKFRGYSYSQLSKLKNKNKQGKRSTDIDKWGYDLKFAYHLVRLLCECEQLLTEETLDLRRNVAILRSIRLGEWKEADVLWWADEKEKSLETVYVNSKLPNRPNETKIKNLLVECLETHYGSLSKFDYHSPTKIEQALKDIKNIVSNL